MLLTCQPLASKQYNDYIQKNCLIMIIQQNCCVISGISGNVFAGFKSYLSYRHQFVAMNEEVSYQSQVIYGVHRCSVLGPLLFTLYMLPFGDIIRKHSVSFHCYADDTQIYISSQPGEIRQIEKLMECIVGVKNWMTTNFLLLNSEKNRGVNYWT